MGRSAGKPPEGPAVPNRDPTTCILSQLVKTGDDVLQSDVQVKERRWQWARPQVEGAGPSARGGHTATLVHPPKSSAKIVIFGGHYDSGSGDGPGSQGFVFLNDTHILDIDENTWYQPRCRGTAPEPRYGHSAALVGTRIVYFGGKGKGQNFRDLHAMDTSTMTWYQGPSSGGAPSARHGHSATLQGTRLFVFGGACGARFFGDLHCLDLASMAWSSPQTQGPKPTARYSHAALLIGESLVIHGGFCMETADIAAKDNSGQLMKQCYRDDIRVLDLGRMLWSRLRTHGSPPVARFGHTLCLSEDDALMFGGWSGSNKAAAGVEYNLKDKTQGAAAENPEEEESNDYCMTLRTSDMQWIKNRYVGVPPTRRYGHSATGIGPHLIIFGGWDGGKPLGDVVVLRDRTVGAQADDTGFDTGLDADEAAEAAAGFDEDFQGGDMF